MIPRSSISLFSFPGFFWINRIVCFEDGESPKSLNLKELRRDRGYMGFLGLLSHKSQPKGVQTISLKNIEAG